MNEEEKEEGEKDKQEDQNEIGADPEIELTKATTLGSRTRFSLKKAAENDDGEPEGQLTIDVYQTATDIVIESAIAGVDPEDLDINVTTDSVSIIGRRRREKVVKEEDYFYRECYWGKFSRSIILPQEIEPEDSRVTLKNGILTILLPKLNKRKSKKLKVKLD